MVNDPRAVLTYFAAWTLGATIVPINPAEDEERIRYILHHSRAKACSYPKKIRRNGANWRRHRPHPRTRTIHFPTICPLSAALCDYDSAEVSTPVATSLLTRLSRFPHPEDAECLIVYTSGTTGPAQRCCTGTRQFDARCVFNSPLDGVRLSQSACVPCGRGYFFNISWNE